MRSLKRNQITLYLCRRDLNNTDVKVFLEPTALGMNFNVTQSKADMMTFGENYINYARSNVSNELGILFSKFDRIYFTNPIAFDPLCNDADYEVYGVLPSINGTEIIYKRLSGSNVH